MDYKNINMSEVNKLISEKKLSILKAYLLEYMPADIAEVIEELSLKDALLVYRLIPKDLATEVFSLVEVDRQSELTSLVNDAELLEILDELNFDDMIDLIEEVPASMVKKILKNSTYQERKLINQFLKYPDDSAGSLMTIEFVDLKRNMTVRQCLDRIKATGVDKETIYTCYVLGRDRMLEGIVSLKNLVLNDYTIEVEKIMADEFIAVRTDDDQEVVAEIFKKYDLLSLPVVDHEGRLVGIITVDDIMDVIEEENTEDFQKMAALEPTDVEYLDMTPFALARKRIVWLVVLMFSATLSQLITDNYANLTAQFTILVGVMPMLMGAGGNAGAQSSTLVIRGITLGEIEFKDIVKVVWKEVRVGLLLGITLGILNFIRIVLFNNNASLAMTVGFTLIGTTTVAAIMGGLLPIIANQLKLDPAIMASPLITTITDATTLMIFFNIATLIFLG